ncbi:MAG: DUF7948 domain-containing protein, partial [Bacteroidia bacterium]
MKAKLLLLALCLLAANAFSQSIPNIDTTANVTAPGTNATGNSTAVMKANGNVYITGVIQNSTKDLFLAKYDSNLVLRWFKIYDNGYDDIGKSVFVDPATENIYANGSSEQSSGNSDLITLAYDSSGTQLWTPNRFNGTANGLDGGLSVTYDGTAVWSGGFSTTTSKGKDFTLLRISASTGSLLATAKKNGSSNSDDVCNKVFVYGNSLYATGYANNTGNGNDIFTLCINTTSATVTWTNVIAGSYGGADEGNDITADANHAVLCGKMTNSVTGSDYFYAVLTPSTGVATYTNTYDGGFSGTDVASSITKDKLGNYILTGAITNGSSLTEYHTQSYTASGRTWTHPQPINCNYTTQLPRITVDTLNHIYVSGTYSNSTQDALLYQLTPSGNQTWKDTYNNPTYSARDINTDLVVDGLGRLYLSSIQESGTATNTYYVKLIKYSQTPVYMPCNYNMLADTFNITHLFYPNMGQVRDTGRAPCPNVLFHTRFTNPAEYIQKNAVSFCYYKCDTAHVNPSDTVQRMDMIFAKANSNSEIFPVDYQPNAVINYFMDYTGTGGLTNIAGASHLIVPNIYPLTDLHYSSNAVGSKYYFVLKPGADPARININFNGASSTTISGTDLNINSPYGNLTFKKPDIYNVSVASYTNLSIITTSVTGSSGWVSMGSNTYSINPGSYSSSWPLVIEFDMGKAASTSSVTTVANVYWSTYIGGPANDEVKDVKIEASTSNLYAVGRTLSPTFPTSVTTSVYQPAFAGVQDGFLAKFTNTVSGQGVPAWTTFVGANKTDYLTSLDVHPSTGDIYCVGTTNSNSITVVSKSGATNSGWIGPYDSYFGYMYDGLIFQVDNTGQNAKWISYYGGNKNDQFYKCKFDNTSTTTPNFFAVGSTFSTDAPLQGTGSEYIRAYSLGVYSYTDALTDGYIVRFDNNSSRTWATTIGSDAGLTTALYGPRDELYDLTFDGSGDLYVCGMSVGSNYTVTGGGSGISGTTNADAVITRFDNTGVMKFSTYLGGNGWEQAEGINMNPSISSDVYVTGYAGTGFPTTNSGQYYYTSSNAGGDDVFFTAYNSSNSRTHSTYIGGANDDHGRDVEVDNSGFIWISGKTGDNSLYAPSPNSLGYNFGGAGNTELFLLMLKKGYPDVGWTCTIGGNMDESDPATADDDAEITVDNAQDFLYLGGKSYKSLPTGTVTLTTKYPIIGIAPTYTQSINGQNDGVITAFEIGSVHRTFIGINEIKNLSSNGLMVYPNPTNYDLNVKLTNFKDKYTYIVY